MGRTFIPFRNLWKHRSSQRQSNVDVARILCVVGTETGSTVGSASVHDLSQARQEPPVLVLNLPDPLVLDLQLLELELNLELACPRLFTFL